MKRAAHIIVLLTLVISAQAADPRQLPGPDAPLWLRSIGKLTVPGYRFVEGERQHYTEHCSATLVAADIVLSAWHCLEYYRDLAQPIWFTLAGQRHEVRTLSAGGDMDADWALLRLIRPLRAQPLATAFPPPSTLTGSAVTMAGFSADPGLGQSGDILSYHRDCQVLAINGYRVHSNCLAFKGASGGPVLWHNKVIGVISTGDSHSQSFFIASAAFASELRRYLSP